MLPEQDGDLALQLHTPSFNRITWQDQVHTRMGYSWAHRTWDIHGQMGHVHELIYSLHVSTFISETVLATTTAYPGWL